MSLFVLQVQISVYQALNDKCKHKHSILAEMTDSTSSTAQKLCFLNQYLSCLAAIMMLQVPPEPCLSGPRVITVDDFKGCFSEENITICVRRPCCSHLHFQMCTNFFLSVHHPQRCCMRTNQLQSTTKTSQTRSPLQALRPVTSAASSRVVKNPMSPIRRRVM